LAFVWFPKSELAISSAIGNGALAFGNAIGFFMSPAIVKGPVGAYDGRSFPENWAHSSNPESEEALDEVTRQLFWLFFGQAAFGF